MKRKLRTLLIVLGLALAVLVLYQLALDFLPDIKLYFKMVGNKGEAALLKQVRSHGLTTGLLLILLTCIFTAIPGLPVGFIAVFSGVCYGPINASFMNVIGVSLGNLLTYSLIKNFKIIDKSSNKWVKSISKNRHPDLSIVTAYMIPIIPSIMVNYSASALNIPFRKIVLMVVIGAIPSSLLYAFGGDALFKGNKTLSAVLIISVGLLVLLLAILKRGKKEKSVA